MMKIKEGFMLRSVAGQSIVVPFGSSTVDFNGMISLNDSGAFLWNLLTTETDETTLLQEFLKEYDVDEQTAKQAINGFVTKVREASLLE